MRGGEHVLAFLQWLLRACEARLGVVVAASIVVLTAIPLPIRAQVVPGPPSDALVLGAGGARGLAHVGALVALAEAGYAPDLVIGTSMGAVVGALYAAGLTPAEIEALVRGEDWQALMLPVPEWMGLDRRGFVPQLRFAFAGTEHRPIDGFIDDRGINRTLLRALFDANMRARGDFDALATPYRAVASDLRDGSQVTIASGDLARAARTSLAVHGAFAPLEWNGAVLADGGVANYLATSIATRAGARRVVAIDVLRPKADPGRPDPITALFRGLRLTFHNTLSDTTADVLIVPDVAASTSSAVFPTDPSRFIQLGYEAARRALSDSGAASPGRGRLNIAGASGAARLAGRALPPAPASIAGLEIDTEPGLAGIVRSAFEGAAGLRGDSAVPYEPDRILAAADRLYATGLFAGVWPAPGPGPSVESVALRVRADPRPPLEASAAVAYDHERGAGGWLRTAWRPGAGPLSLSGALLYDGIETSAALEVARPLTSLPPVSWTAGAALRRSDVPFPIDEMPSGVSGSSRSTAGGTVIGTAVRVDRVGAWLGIEWRRVAPDVTASAIIRAQQLTVAGTVGNAIGPYLRIERHTPPSRPVGGPTGLEVEAMTGDFAFQRARLFAGPAITLGWLSLALNLDAAAATDETPPDAIPSLGDHAALPGLAWGQERGRARLVLGPDIAAPVPLDGFLRLRLRAGAATAEPADWFEADPWLGGAALEGVWHSIVGQLVVGVGAASNGDRRLVLRVGGSY